MAEKALILSADSWEMPDDRTGEIRKGVSVWYVNDYRVDNPTSVGFKPTKVSADLSMLDVLRGAKLPALFNLDFGSRPGVQGKATLTLVAISHIADVPVFMVPSDHVSAAKVPPKVPA